MEFAYTPFSPTSPPGLTPDHEFFSSPTTPQYPQPEHFDWHIDGAVDSTDFSHFQNGVLSPEETGGYGKYLAHHHNEQAYVESQPKQHDHGFFASRAAFLRSGLPQLDTTLLAPELWVEQPWSPQTHAVSAPPQMEGWNAIPTPHSQHFLTPPINAPLYIFPSQLSASPTSTTRFNFDDCWARSPFSETEFRQADLPAMDALSLSPVSFVSPQTIFSPYPGSGNDSPTTYNEPEHTPRGKGGKFAPSREARLDRFIKRKKRQRATADTAKATCKECGSHFTTNYNLSQYVFPSTSNLTCAV